MTEEWPAQGFDARLAQADRVVVLFHADWCPYSRMLLAEYEDAAPEAMVACVRANLRHPLDPRWDDHAISVVPTLAYHEKGEMLERLDAERGVGLSRRDLDVFLEHVDSLNEAELPRWLKRRRQPTSRRP